MNNPRVLYGSTYVNVNIVTAVFLSQGARALLEDDLDLSGGIYTPACLGQGYVDRLEKSGFKMETRIIED